VSTVFVTSEQLGPDRVKTYFRRDAEVDFSIPQLGSYWEIEVDSREPHRVTYYVRKDGWHVCDVMVREYLDGTEVRMTKPLEPIPDWLASHLPKIGVTNRARPSNVY
jgi:hypothetical protein